jgi:hypothetical protein
MASQSHSTTKAEIYDYEIAVRQHQGRTPLITNQGEQTDVELEVFRDDYEEVGVDFVQAETLLEAAWQMVPRWNNGSGQESEAFREANEAQRATSFSTGDILIVIRSDCEEREMYISDGFSLAPINLV